MKGRDGIARSLYVTATGRRVVVLRRKRKRRRAVKSIWLSNEPRRWNDAKTIKAKKVIAKWREDPAFMEAYEALEPEFALASQVIQARAGAGLTQAELAERMGTSQSALARLESGKGRPSVATLEKLVKATGSRLRIAFEGA